MTFGAPQYFWALLLLPLLAAIFLRSERTSMRRLQDFVAPRLLPQLTATVNHFRRGVRFALQLLAFVLVVLSLAQPRWGYTFEDVKRKGIDLLVAVDTSRSMLSNDVQPSRLERVKLATQDLISQLQGDRVGLIAFAGRAFVQAPLTIDYDAVVEAINDLDTKTIPEGGTNISEAIALADRTYGKSAVGNRAFVIFTDGEELSGDAMKAAKAAADAGIKIFTIGVGTPEGSLIPIRGDEGDTAFVKDSKGQVVKSKLDEKRLREIAQATGGFYLHLENGPRTMKQLFADGPGKMNAGEIDVRLSRRPIERYQWPLSAAIAALAISILIGDRKRARNPRPASAKIRVGAPVAATVLLLLGHPALAAAPGLDFYWDGKFNEAYQEFQQTLKAHPQTEASDKLQFDAGAAAYKMKDYGKALESYSQALLSPDPGLQSKSHYNLGNTLYQRGETQPGDDKKLGDWTNALQHYEQTLQIDPKNQEAKENYEYVKKKIEELKKKKQEQPPPPPKQDKQDKDKNKDRDDKQDKRQQQQQDQDKQQQQQQQDQQQQSQAQNQPGTGQNQKPQNEKDQSQAKNEPQKNQQPKPDQTPSPSPEKNQAGPSPSPSGNDRKNDQQQPSPSSNATPSPSPGEGEDTPSPSPSPSEGEGEGSDQDASPSPGPSETPKKKFAGEVNGAGEDKSDKPDQPPQVAEVEKEGEMSERQAEALLRSMKDEEARVQLDERRAARHVYNDW